MLKNNNIITRDNLVDHTQNYSLDKNEVHLGSIPQDSIEKIIELINENDLKNGLQIGGFVGITHCCLAYALKDKGTMCTIDPNIEHRKIKRPMDIAIIMATEYKLMKNSMFICGYAQQQMEIFYSLGLKFDFILIDGDHQENIYSEIEQADRILKTNGLLIIDDIDHWDFPKKSYENFPLESRYKKIPVNKRIGVLSKLSC